MTETLWTLWTNTALMLQKLHSACALKLRRANEFLTFVLLLFKSDILTSWQTSAVLAKTLGQVIEHVKMSKYVYDFNKYLEASSVVYELQYITVASLHIKPQISASRVSFKVFLVPCFFCF